jgi:hypothetical protein
VDLHGPTASVTNSRSNRLIQDGLLASVAKSVMQLHCVDPDTGEIVNSRSSGWRFSNTLRIALRAG